MNLCRHQGDIWKHEVYKLFHDVPFHDDTVMIIVTVIIDHYRQFLIAPWTDYVTTCSLVSSLIFAKQNEASESRIFRWCYSFWISLTSGDNTNTTQPLKELFHLAAVRNGEVGSKSHLPLAIESQTKASQPLFKQPPRDHLDDTCSSVL